MIRRNGHQAVNRDATMASTPGNGKNATVLTTGQVAKICNVAPRTVSKWFDSGQLRGYRIPGSKDRRIPVDQLVRFMKAHGIPTTGLDMGVTGVVLLESDESFAKSLADALVGSGEFEVHPAATAFEAGVLVERHRPRVVVLDVAAPGVDPRQIVRTLRSHEHLCHLAVIGTADHLSEGQRQGLTQAGFSDALGKPYDLAALRQSIERQLA